MTKALEDKWLARQYVGQVGEKLETASSIGATVDLEAAIGALFDDQGFVSIHGQISPLNLFEAVGATRSELRHSNFLAYLLSPSRPHGLGAKALVAVLRSILAQLPANDRPIMTLELLAGELDDAIIYRERANIDILVVLPSLKLVVAIENKVDAKASDGQLERYSDYLKRDFRDHRQLLVFLTPHGGDPDHGDYAAYDYRQLAETLESLIETGSDIPTETRLLIRHYVEMVRRHIVQDDRLRSLAQQLYERHKEAFDFIYDCRPEPLSLLTALRLTVQNVDGLIEDSAGTNVFRFVPTVWDEKLRTIKGDPNKWSRTGRGLLFEVKTYASIPGRVNVSLIIGAGEAKWRSAVHARALSQQSLFSGIVKSMGQQFATIFSRDLLTSAQAQGLTSDMQSTNVALAWSDFQARQLQALIQAVISIDDELTDSER
ncbi:PD-(D/E)XK nuclease family protein [Mesorhizobium sp. L2C067A000]|uniref:PDDEXK-like family protein n=1 Tax=Mesorhizobium sp. L2C067A000 TaxID=1287106 RepID=UPI0003D04624|nr:PD-(D/E)XK nuclease family protein [Mesorhizobium sp. L2C067A000]ESZ26609.1 hypothetical protein X733_29520 [Mesorhizobium sp. L2C067A000]